MTQAQKTIQLPAMLWKDVPVGAAVLHMEGDSGPEIIVKGEDSFFFDGKEYNVPSVFEQREFYVVKFPE